MVKVHLLYVSHLRFCGHFWGEPKDNKASAEYASKLESLAVESQCNSQPGCWIVGLVAIVWLTTEANNQSSLQSSLHWVIVLTDVMSDHIGRRDASHADGCSKTSAYTGQFGWASMIWSMLSVAALLRRKGGATLLITGMKAAWVAGSLKSGALNYEVGFRWDLCSWI